MRRKFLLKSHDSARYVYGRFFKKNQPWMVTKVELMRYPHESLGLSLGEFLVENQIELVPKFENHDAMHVLTNVGITLLEEVALKCYLLGNGRMNIYHLFTTIGGIVLYPEKIPYFNCYYKAGRRAKPFHYIDFERLLDVPIKDIRQKYLISCLTEY